MQIINKQKHINQKIFWVNYSKMLPFNIFSKLSIYRILFTFRSPFRYSLCFMFQATISENKEFPFVYTNFLHDSVKQASSPKITNNDFLGNKQH